jgi:capsular polysaccharide biosynthesis protein
MHRILPLEWLDEFEGVKKVLLKQGGTGSATGPAFIGAHAKTAQITLPDVHYYEFRNGRVSANSSSIIFNDQTAVIERFINPDQYKFDYFAGQIAKHDTSAAVVDHRKHANVERGIFLAGNGSSNYYHWIVEILSKSEFFNQLPDKYREFPVLVNEDYLSFPSFKETLEIFLGEREVVRLKTDVAYTVAELLYINTPNILPFNLSPGTRFEISNVAIDDRSIAYLRKTVLEAIAVNEHATEYPKRIFLCRKNNRRSYNEEEIYQVLSGYGFVKTYFEELSFAEQVRTVNSAEFIVGPTGAAWTNLIFCRTGTRALCWMASEVDEFSAFSTIAHAVGVDMRYLGYETGVKSAQKIYRQNYSLAPEQVRHGLEQLGLQSA